MWLETTQKGKGAKKGEWTGESRKGLPLHLLLRALLPPLPPPSTLLFALSNTRFRIRPVWNLQLSSTSVSIRFAGFDAVTLANNHLNDFGEKGANFTCEVLKKTGVKYIGVTYGKYDTSQVSITCSDIQHWYKPEMLPISVKLLRRLCTSKRFSVLFSLLYVVYSSPKFLFRGLRIHLPPPPLRSLLRRLCLILLEIFPGYLTAKQLGFSHWLRTRAWKRAKERFGPRVKTENEFGALQDWF